jgi:hypothetical protein
VDRDTAIERIIFDAEVGIILAPYDHKEIVLETGYTAFRQE